MNSRARAVYVLFVLHGHLPYVRHPEVPVFHEESWLYEAIGECYLPLLDVFGRLAADGIACPITLSVSPTLQEMLRDPLLQERYLRYAESRSALSAKILAAARGGEEASVASMYRERHRYAAETFQRVYRRDLATGIRSAAEAAGLELMTTAATHGFLPYLMEPVQAVKAQLGIASEYGRGFRGPAPSGLWLPECGYCGGLDALVRDAGFEYFFLDAHGLLFASPTPEFGPFQPVRTPAGCVAFGRDTGLSGQVWSEGGYPADPVYREFHDDIVFRLGESDVRAFIHPDGLRLHSGLKFSRITGASSPKELYSPGAAAGRGPGHARHFVSVLGRRAQNLLDSGVPFPVVVCAFDAELFGHWWYEGPVWLEEVFRLLARTDAKIRAATASEVYCEYGGRCPEAEPAPSSWGRGGFGDAWLGEGTDELYPELRRATGVLVERVGAAEGRGKKRAADLLEAAARELLLAQSSDWLFLIRSETSGAYARRRFSEHLKRFRTLLGSSAEDKALAGEAPHAGQHGIFKGIRCTDYYRPEGPRTGRPSRTL